MLSAVSGTIAEVLPFFSSGPDDDDDDYLDKLQTRGVKKSILYM
jgi:hypothetical protein